MKKWRTILGLVLNLVAIAACVVPLVQLFSSGLTIEQLGPMLEPLPMCGIVFIGVVGLIALIADFFLLAKKKPCRFVAILKLLSATIGFAALVLTLAYSLSQSADVTAIFNVQVNLWVYIVGPAAAMLSFIFENKPRLHWALSFAGMAPVYIYTIVELLLPVIANKAPAYQFLILENAELYLPLTWIISIAIGSFLMALILILLHNIGAKEQTVIEEEPAAEPVAGEAPAEEAKEEAPAEEPVKEEAEEKPAEEKAEEKAEEPAEEPEKEPEEKKEEPAPAKPAALKPATAANKNRTYHITRQPSGNWQVKLAGGSKAIRVFPTQAEAIAFTKGLVESRGGSYRIHSLKGKIRK